MWPIMPSSFPPKPRVKTRGFNIWKMMCDGSTHFAYFNSWQKLDGETSIVRFRHHSSTYLEGLTKFWGFWGSSAPPYSPFCILKSHTFDPIPLENPSHSYFLLRVKRLVAVALSVPIKYGYVVLRRMCSSMLFRCLESDCAGVLHRPCEPNCSLYSACHPIQDIVH